MNRKKRLLMLSDAGSVWTVRLIEHFLLPEGWEVVLFPIWGDDGRFGDFYRAAGVAVCRDGHTLPLVRRIPRLRMWARIALNARDLIALGPFDAVQCNYLSQRDLALGARVANAFHARFIASFWGSDLLRAKPAALRRMAPFLARAHAVSVHNPASRDRVRAVYGSAIADKTHVLYFGQTGYADIDAVRARLTRTECRARFGLPQDGFVVCLGYSASPAQQQDAALRALAALPRERLSRMTLVLQMTYGAGEADYAARVRDLAARLPCRTVVLTDFLGAQDSAMLRLSADAFVMSIRTDAFSASLQEYLYAGAAVLCGGWLPYPQLSALGIAPHAFASFDDLPALLVRCMDGEIAGLSPAQRALLPRHYAWDGVRASWRALYGET